MELTTQQLTELAARSMYADDLNLTINEKRDCPFYIRGSSGLRTVAFDELPLMMKFIYYAAASAAVVDCTTRGRRLRMGLNL